MLPIRGPLRHRTRTACPAAGQAVASPGCTAPGQQEEVGVSPAEQRRPLPGQARRRILTSTPASPGIVRNVFFVCRKRGACQ